MYLRQQVLHGGIYLVVREGFGIVLSIVGVVFLARLIGPRAYGFYAGGYSIILMTGLIGRMGIDTFLTRREESPSPRLYHEAFTVLLIASVILMLLLFIAVTIAHGRLVQSEWTTVIYAMLPSIPMTLLALPASAQLSRDLRFSTIAMIELSGQVVYYLVALPLAVLGAGLWAPVCGYLGWQAFQWLINSWQTRYVPRLAWSRAGVRELMGYGLGYSTSIWVWQVRLLVNPLVVGRFAGPEGVGYVNLAIRFAEVLCFIKNVAWRISIAALAKVQRDLPRLRRGMEEAMTLQVLGVGAPLAGFALLAPFFAGGVFGAEWESAFSVFPFIALGYLVNAAFNMHSATLYVLNHNLDVTKFHMVHVALFVGSSLLFVPRYDTVGYGLAELTALLSYPVIHVYLSRVFPVSYRDVVPWMLAVLPPLFAVFLPPAARLLTCIPGIILLTFGSRQRGQIGEYLGYIRRWRPA